MRRLLPHALAAAALFTLPACAFNTHGICNDPSGCTDGTPPANFDAGPSPQSSIIFCDIEKRGTGFDGTNRQCVDAAPSDVVSQAVPMTSAALDLNSGQGSEFAIDKSPDAVSRCGANGELVDFAGNFPQGRPQCINCGAQIPNVFADADKACQAICDDISQIEPENPPPPDVAAFCQNHARASTNMPVAGCPMGFAGACSDSGTELASFLDPRMFPDPVVWTNLIGVAPGGTANNDLSQTAASSASYVAGAASTQWTTEGGDAYVEFGLGETNKTHVIGFTALGPSASFPDDDNDPTPGDINFALDLGNDGRVYILQGGTLLPGPDIAQSWDTYTTSDRFRVTLIDRGDKTYDVVFSKVIGSCSAGSPCNETKYITLTPGAQGPFRVDTAFHDNGASVTNVVLMFVHKHE